MRNNSSIRPVIYVAESPEQAMNYDWDSSSKALSRNVSVMAYDDIRELGKGKDNFFLPDNFTSGDVLIRHPYNQGYILVTDDTEIEYMKASADGIFLIARCLGATKICYKKSDIAEYHRELDSNNSVKYKVVDLSLNVKKSTEQKLINRIKKEQEFEKYEYTIAQWEKARLIAQARGLLVSQDIRSLFDARNPNLGALMKRETVNVEMSSSLNQVLDIAFTINAVPLFNMNSNTKIVTERKRDVTIEWDIIF